MPPAPTISKPAPNGPQTSPSPNQAAPALIPFTRAARKKRRQVTQISYNMTAAAQQLPVIQIPANGYLKKLTLDVQATTAANAAATAFQNDAPFSAIQSVGLTAANGDTLIVPLSGFTAAMQMKYGVFGHTRAFDPLADPNYAVTTGAGTTGGSFHFQLDIPIEVDPRDALCALPNMAANQAFNLQLFAGASGTVYTTAPTTLPPVTITVTAEYWAAPTATNAQGIPQQTGPRVRNAVSLLQSDTPPITANAQNQNVQLINVGNTIRYLYFELRTAAGVRTDADWPTVFSLLVNNDLWDYKTSDNWRRQMAEEYGLTGGVSSTPTLNHLDTGVWVYTDFVNDGAQGSGVVSSSANRDLMLVTGSGTSLSFQASQWGASASQLLVVTNALRIPDPTSFYAPFGI